MFAGVEFVSYGINVPLRRCSESPFAGGPGQRGRAATPVMTPTTWRQGLTMSFYDIRPDDPAYTNTVLRMEVGWYEVRKGLNRILMGYFTLIGGVLFGFGLIVMTCMMESGGKKFTTSQEVGFMVGLGVWAITGFVSWGMLVAGHWQCLMNAPDRRGAKWLMFVCMTCVAIGPAMNAAASASGLNKNYDLIRQGPVGLRKLDTRSTAGFTQVTGTVLCLAASVLFILFLRAVASCFEDRARVGLSNLYLLFCLVLGGGTAYLIFGDPRLLAQKQIVQALGVGWLVCFIGYLFLIGSISRCINVGMRSIRSPLEA
jgi:hypothetical protein